MVTNSNNAHFVQHFKCLWTRDSFWCQPWVPFHQQLLRILIWIKHEIFALILILKISLLQLANNHCHKSLNFRELAATKHYCQLAAGHWPGLPGHQLHLLPGIPSPSCTILQKTLPRKHHEIFEFHPGETLTLERHQFRGAHSNIPLRNIAISLKEHLILNQNVDFISKCMAVDPPKKAE